jgi:aspartate carbamoyltransferase regulatory subunit
VSPREVVDLFRRRRRECVSRGSHALSVFCRLDGSPQMLRCEHCGEVWEVE